MVQHPPLPPPEAERVSDFFRLIGEWLQFIWPMRKVQQWEHGLRYRFGRYRRTVGPGIYWIVPWFTDVLTVSTVPAITQTPRIDITAQDGTMVTLQASATVQVTEPNRAVNHVDQYLETTQELITAVVAEKLAKVDASRLAPEGRGYLLRDLRMWVDKECADFGVAVSKLRFTTFVVNPRPFRLLGDRASVAEW